MWTWASCQLDDRSKAIAKESNVEEHEDEGNYHIEGDNGPLNNEIEGSPKRTLEQEEIGILATWPRCICIGFYWNSFSITKCVKFSS